MHPAGIQFGLAHNMLQLRGDAVVLSDTLLRHMSTAARRQLHGKRIDGTDLLDHVIDRGWAKMKLSFKEYETQNRGGWRSFGAKMHIVVFDTMFVFAERAGIGYRVGRTFYFTRTFGRELLERKKVWRPVAEAYGSEKMLFMACYEAVIARCTKTIPEDSAHFDLLALCMWEVWDSIIMDSFFQKFAP